MEVELPETFQKNLVVWKSPVISSHRNGSSVSEELSSVEISRRACGSRASRNVSEELSSVEIVIAKKQKRF